MVREIGREFKTTPRSTARNFAYGVSVPLPVDNTLLLYIPSRYIINETPARRE